MTQPQSPVPPRPSLAAPLRKRGKEIDLPDLRQKISLLLEGHEPRDGRMRPVFTKQSIIANEMGLDPAELSKAMAGARLSSAKVPALLRLFKLDVADWIVPQTDEDRHWQSLAQEPLHAFKARVRLAGGDDFSGGSGSTWDRFMAGLRQAGRSTPGHPNSFKILAHDRHEWQSPKLSTQVARLGPPDDPLRHAGHQPGLPVLRAGQWAKSSWIRRRRCRIATWVSRVPMSLFSRMWWWIAHAISRRWFPFRKTVHSRCRASMSQAAGTSIRWCRCRCHAGRAVS